LVYVLAGCARRRKIVATRGKRRLGLRRRAAFGVGASGHGGSVHARVLDLSIVLSIALTVLLNVVIRAF
jgi:hypothetical protein